MASVKLLLSSVCDGICIGTGGGSNDGDCCTGVVIVEVGTVFFLSGVEMVLKCE